MKQICIDDTPVSGFAEEEYEIEEQNGEVTLFNNNVVNAPEN